MFLVRLYLFVCVNLFLSAKCSIPVEKLCVNPTCKEPISKAKGTVKYVPSSKEGLAFDKGQEIIIISKSKNKEDYWGAVIKEKSGYVPSRLVQEVKIFHGDNDLIPVTVEETQHALVDEKKPMLNNISDQGPAKEIGIGESNKSQPTESVVGVHNSPRPSNALETSIKADESFKIIEGTTIYPDETDEIKPSTTVDMKSAGQTVDPKGNINSKHDKQGRAIVPTEIIDLNSNYKAQSMQNMTTFSIENVKENDENAVIESRDIDDNVDDDDDDDDGHDDDNDEGEENEEGNEGNEEGDDEDDDILDEGQENLDNQIPVNQFHMAKESNYVVTDNARTVKNLEEISAASTHTVPGSIEGSREQTVVDVVKNSITSEASGSVDNSRIEMQPSVESLPQPSDQNVGVGKVDILTQKASSTWSMLNGKKELNIPSQPAIVSSQISHGTPQLIKSGPPEPTAAPSKSQGTAAELRAMPRDPDIKSEVSFAMEESVSSGTGRGVTASEKSPTEVPVATSPNITDATRDDVLHPTTSPITEEVPAETLGSTPRQVPLETSTIFSQFSVSAGSLPEESSNNIEKPSNVPEIIQEKVEVTTEAFVTSQLVPTETANQFSESTQTWEYLNRPEKVSPENIQDMVQVAAEPTITPSVLVQDSIEESQVIEDEKAPDESSEEVASNDNGPKESTTFSHITEMFSSWFTSSPGKEEPHTEGDQNYEAAFPDIQSEGKQRLKSTDSPSGKCANEDFGSGCREPVASDEQQAWSSWLPSGLGLESVLTSNNTFAYLIVTAVTVLLFTLGHNFIEKRGKTGPLIAKINKLEHELLVSSKECLMLKDDNQSLKEKINLYENSANDELVLSLQAELEESKKVRSELESSIEILQQELDAATEAGLDLNKMLSEVLTQKGGSESLLKSVENLQAQLDDQQKVIDEMTKKLGVKNQENEALQSALEAANDKSESLEEQLGEIKHNLNLHLKEKEDLTRDLNSQINQLKIRINQLGESKEKDISRLNKDLEDFRQKFSESVSALTVKEEELKALKESVKHLKSKGDVKLETVFDISRVKGELAKEVKENHILMERLKSEENSKKALVEQMKTLDCEIQKLRKGYEEAEQKKDEAEKKLEVLSTYFKEKETQLQKELGLQEALWAQKKGDEKAVYNMMKSLQEEVESYKSQNETLKKEILDQERGLKNQIAILEQKAHENWVAARQAERKLEESKQEMAQLRNRLTLIEKNSSNAEGKGTLRSSEELNGLEAASPILHDTSSPLLFPPLPLDPNSSSLLPPAFIPPPMFMPPPMGGFIPPPPFLPGDRRPPPLGRMSSPPLNNRFSPSSPADYPFERMSSPPLSPPATNYRSPNEDREHYRHRTPPYPPPLHPRNWDDSNEMPGFIPISSQRDSRRNHKGSNVSSEHSSSESLDKSSRHSGRV